MNKECACNYCMNEVNEYFCVSCFHNFNECESFHKFDGAILCPKCHPENDIMMEVAKILAEQDKVYEIKQKPVLAEDQYE